MAFHVSFFNQQQSSKLGGWGESFWSLLPDVPTLTPIALNLATLLDQLKGAQCYIPSFRISDATTFRAVTNVLTGFGTGSAITATTDADYPSTALQLKLGAPSGGSAPYRTLQWLRGLPDAIVSNSGTYHPNNSFNTALNRILAELKNGSSQWAVNVLNRLTSKRDISGFNPTTGVVTVPAHGYTIGTIIKVRIKGAGIRNLWNGLWNVTVIDANTISVNFWVVPNPLPFITGKRPTCTQQIYTQIAIATAAPGNISSHYTGRPTGLLGGRRRIRKH